MGRRYDIGYTESGSAPQNLSYHMNQYRIILNIYYYGTATMLGKDLRNIIQEESKLKN